MADEHPADERPAPVRPSGALTRRRVIIAGGTAGAALVVSQVVRLIGDDDGTTAAPDTIGPGTTGRPDPTEATAPTTERGADTSHEGHTDSTVGDTVPEGTVPPGDTLTAISPDGSRVPWSDPATWGGRLPAAGDVVVADVPVLLDIDAEVAGVRIGAAGTLEFDPAATRSLASRGNIVVAGALVLRPASVDQRHEIGFLGVDEAAYVGGHTDTPLDTDVGLWVVEGGVLDAVGATKTSWTHLAGAADTGATEIVVDDADGWLPGDEIVVTPTEAPTVEDHWTHHDRHVIAGVDGTTLTLEAPLAYPHPEVTVRDGVTHRAEVLNLTRNVLISGRPEGRAHAIFNMTTTPQQLAHVAFRHMGPRQDDVEVLGRYAIHFHAGYEGSIGSNVDSVVVADSTGHGFASHLSDGVTFTQCVAHDMVDDAFWWDLSLDGGGRNLVPSNGITYDRCVASYVKAGKEGGFNLAGFLIGAGAGNVARGCVAVGVEGGAESASGYHWPSLSRDENVWTFEDNLSHNLKQSGIYFWQNGKNTTLVKGFTAYHCKRGIFAGAYSNLVSYESCTLYANAKEGLVIQALPAQKARDGSTPTITYTDMYVDQAGLTEYAVMITKHIGRSTRTTTIRDSTFKGGTVAQVGIPKGGDKSQRYDFEDCTFEGNVFWLADDVPADTTLRVIGDENYTVVRADQDGEANAEWNAAVVTD